MGSSPWLILLTREHSGTFFRLSVRKTVEKGCITLMILKGKLKKIAACALVVTMLTPLAGTAAWADPPPHAKAHGRNKEIMALVKLHDIRGHWAEEILTEMNLTGLIKGYDDNEFKPSNVVKNVEALVMLVRGLGLEEQALEEGDADEKQFRKLPDWARGYVRVALDRELLTPEDLEKFNPNQGLKRAQLCAILAKALELDPEAAGEYELDFSDKEAIPEDLLGYVRAIVANGIMKGYENNVFQPNKPVTRAEMAVLLDRLGDLLHEQENRRVEGTLVKLDSDYITLQIEDTVKELALADDVLVYLNRENVELEDLVAGDRVRLAVKDGKVVLIRAQRAAVVETTHQGRLIRLVLGTSSKVTMMEKDTELTFKVDENTRIRVAGKRALLKDLEVGREVAVTAQGDLAVRIEQE